MLRGHVMQPTEAGANDVPIDCFGRRCPEDPGQVDWSLYSELPGGTEGQWKGGECPSLYVCCEFCKESEAPKGVFLGK